MSCGSFLDNLELTHLADGRSVVRTVVRPWTREMSVVSIVANLYNIATVPPSTHSTARKISRNFFGHFAGIGRAADRSAARLVGHRLFRWPAENVGCPIDVSKVSIFHESIAVRRNIPTVPPSTHSTARKISRNFFGHFANTDRAAEKFRRAANFSVGRQVVHRKVGRPTNFSVDDLAADPKVGGRLGGQPTFRRLTWRSTQRSVVDLAGSQLFGRRLGGRPKSWSPTETFRLPDRCRQSDRKISQLFARRTVRTWGYGGNITSDRDGLAKDGHFADTDRAAEKSAARLVGRRLFGRPPSRPPKSRLPDRCQQNIQIFSQLFARLVFGSPFKVHFWPPLLRFI